MLFTDGFSGYNQVPIVKEDKRKQHFYVNLGPLPRELCLLG